MIEIRGLAKTYAGHVALKNVSLSIRPGEFVVVLGPSGAGKSTLLRCINRLTAPSGGEIVVDGTPFSSSGRDLRLLRRNVAMIFQQHNLVKRLSRAEERAGRPHGRSLADPELAAALPRGRRPDRAPLPRAGGDEPQGHEPRRRPVGRRAAEGRHRPRARPAAEVHAGRRARRQPRPQDVAHGAHLPQEELQGLQHRGALQPAPDRLRARVRRTHRRPVGRRGRL